MASFVILLIACTARIACSDRHAYIQTDRQTDTHETTTVTLSAHARRGLMTTASGTLWEIVLRILLCALRTTLLLEVLEEGHCYENNVVVINPRCACAQRGLL